MTARNLMTTEYGNWVKLLMSQEWKAYLITFMFKQLRGSRKAILAQMEEEVEITYARLLTRIIRCPGSRKNLERRPFWIMCPDFPVPKHLKKSIREVTINSGMHIQGVAFVPSNCRLKSNDLALEIEENWCWYVRPCVSKLHAVRITRGPLRTMRYLLKSIERGRASWDDLQILPRSSGWHAVFWESN